ncbi:phospholipase D family protein [Ralstonia pseudosolanacearum]|uniref:phospholipase D family nuclease n=1 Tax=Ralstonia pseudosolanacearum TaxID=1310165 RepID=UPI003AAAA561
MMPRRLLPLLSGLALASVATFCPIVSHAEGVSLQNTGTVTVYFSPGGGAAEAIAQAIQSARTRVWLAGYEFTHPRIARALVQAADPRRHVDVRIVLDQGNTRSTYTAATYLARAGVPVRIDWTHPLMHQKTIVIDDEIVGLGSMNFTRAGDEKNSENWNVFRGNPQLVQLYAQAFLQLHAQSTPYQSKGQ